jgi:hypothetical protein
LASPCALPTPPIDLLVTGDATIGGLATTTISVEGVQLQEGSLVVTDDGVTTLPSDFPSFGVVIFQEPSLNAVLQLPAGALLQPGYRLEVVNTTIGAVWVQVAATDRIYSTRLTLINAGKAAQVKLANVASFYYVGYNSWYAIDL